MLWMWLRICRQLPAVLQILWHSLQTMLARLPRFSLIGHGELNGRFVGASKHGLTALGAYIACLFTFGILASWLGAGVAGTVLLLVFPGAPLATLIARFLLRRMA